MCGICGWLDKGPVDEAILQAMTRELLHRGPDAQGIEIFKNVGLGHTRLSIIDLSRNANQPMHNEDKSLWLVYNGEFYTFFSFKKELQSKGHRFISNTDSEVLLHLYEEEGPEFVKKLRGMFVFGIWDSKNKQLMLARDRVGIKPLYYFHKGSKFIFASELKALLRNPFVDRDVSLDAIGYYFTLGYIPRHHCIFKSIRKLLPGCYLLYKNGEVTIHSYWKLPERSGIPIKSNEEYAEEFLPILEEAVRIRLISDVPLGVFLSGGVDSSIVTTIMAQNSSQPIKTFSIGFEEAKYDELPYARQVARHVGSDHHELIVGLKQSEMIEKLVHYYDEPFADSSAIPTYYVSKMAKNYVTVILSGDGGDELFCGYNWYDWVLRRRKLHFIPYFIRKTSSLLGNLPSWNYRGKRFLNDLCLDEYQLFMIRTRFFSGDEISKLLKFEINTRLNEYEHFYKNAGQSAIDRMTRTDFSYYLVDDILTKVDRASMAVALEARVPLLDHKVCEFAFSLPETAKIKSGIKKYLLKKIAKKLLPSGFPLERKQGFSVPLQKWLIGPLGDKVMESITGGCIRDMINAEFVDQMLREHRATKNNHDQKLWAILVFALWGNKYLR